MRLDALGLFSIAVSHSTLLSSPCRIGIRIVVVFTQDIHREFDAAIPYVVSRVMTGYVEETLPATDTVIITGDIVMDGMDVS